MIKVSGKEEGKQEDSMDCENNTQIRARPTMHPNTPAIFQLYRTSTTTITGTDCLAHNSLSLSPWHDSSIKNDASQPQFEWRLPCVLLFQ